MEMNKLQLHATGTNLTHAMLRGKKSNSKEYILYSLISIKFKNLSDL